MYEVVTPWRPSKGAIAQMAKLPVSASPGDSETGPLQGSSRMRATWYWHEDTSRLSSHNPNMIKAPAWVQYAGSVATELEAAMTKFQHDPARFRYHNTDLTDRISTTGTEAKAHGEGTGCKYKIDFQRMLQVNMTSGYERPVLREMSVIEPTVIQLDSAKAPTLGKPARLNSDDSVHDDDTNLADQPLLELMNGQLIQVQKRRSDGVWYGSVLFATGSAKRTMNKAGWFPMQHLAEASTAMVSTFRASLGSAGAAQLAPPPTWADQVNQTSVAKFPVSLTSREGQALSAKFMSTMRSSRVSIRSITRIQNVSMWQSYAVKRIGVMKRDTGTQYDSSRLERVYLFHGTSQDTADKIMQQGFNRSFCGKNATAYGKGVYFARDAAYSSSRTYSVPDSRGVQRMFMVRVTVGEFCRGNSGQIAPDVLDPSTNTLYDTTVDNLHDPSIFVTYHDAQAYPEYMIEFTS